MPNFEILRLEQLDSTNNYLIQHAFPQLTPMVVTAEFQTAGRGQRGASWESEPYKNLMMSIQCRPHWLDPNHQFLLSQAFALSVKDTLSDYTSGITIKWPNDIYWEDRKIAGILIECFVTGRQLDRMILGLGLNINQEHFISDAPNPVSLRQILHRELDREKIFMQILSTFETYYNQAKQGDSEEINTRYQHALYRLNQKGDYKDTHGVFQAVLKGVRSDGKLQLIDQMGHERCFAFKEVKYILEQRDPERNICL